MNIETERIIKQAVEEVNRKYVQEAIYDAEDKGRKEGRKEGMEKAQEDIARKLKGILSPEQISKITGLSLSKVLLL